VADYIAHAFIAAEETKQAVDYLALFSDDALFMDNSNASMRERGPDLMRNGQGFVIYLFQQEDWRIKFNSHFIADDGRYIALSGTWTDTGKNGNLVSVPIQIILEVRDGKIVRQDDYYDSDPYY
jgi:ketosteroid isomerase-like protein